jgi:hypothetical protein
MVFWLVRAVTYKTSICWRYLSLASWGEPRWNPCHSLIFDYPFQLRGKWPTPVILENHGCKFTHSWKTAINQGVCVRVWKINYLYKKIYHQRTERFCPWFNWNYKQWNLWDLYTKITNMENILACLSKHLWHFLAYHFPSQLCKLKMTSVIWHFFLFFANVLIDNQVRVKIGDQQHIYVLLILDDKKI